MESVLRPPRRKKDAAKTADQILNPGFAGERSQPPLDVLRGTSQMPTLDSVPKNAPTPPSVLRPSSIVPDPDSGWAGVKSRASRAISDIRNLPEQVRQDTSAVGDRAGAAADRMKELPSELGRGIKEAAVAPLKAGMRIATELPGEVKRAAFELNNMPTNAALAVGDNLYERATGQPAATQPGFAKRPSYLYPNHSTSGQGGSTPGRSDAAIPAAGEASAANQKSEAASVSGNILRPGSSFRQSATGEWTADGGRRTGIFTPTGEPVARAATAEEMAATAERNASSPYNDPRNISVGGPINVQYLRPSGGAVFGRNDRADALARNREDIQRGNILRKSGPERQQMQQQQAQAVEDSRFDAAMGLEQRKLDQQDTALQLQDEKQQTMLEALAKQAEAAGQGDVAKWMREQIGAAIARGTDSGDRNKETGEPIPRDLTPTEIKDFATAISGLVNPPNDLKKIQAMASEHLRAYSRLPAEEQALAKKEPAVIKSAQLAYNHYMKAPDRARAAMDRSAWLPVVKEILGKA